MKISNICLFILEICGLSASLASSALKRLHSGFRPATAAKYNRMFRDFLAFLETVQMATCQVNTVVILSYMEYLYQKGLSHANIANHLTAIRASFLMYVLNTDPFRDERLPLFIKV